MDVWWFPTISHVKILNHPIETYWNNHLYINGCLEFQVGIQILLLYLSGWCEPPSPCWVLGPFRIGSKNWSSQLLITSSPSPGYEILEISHTTFQAPKIPRFLGTKSTLLDYYTPQGRRPAHVIPAAMLKDSNTMGSIEPPKKCSSTCQVGHPKTSIFLTKTPKMHNWNLKRDYIPGPFNGDGIFSYKWLICMVN